MKTKVKHIGEPARGGEDLPSAARLVENSNPLGKSSWLALAALAAGRLRLFRHHQANGKVTVAGSIGAGSDIIRTPSDARPVLVRSSSGARPVLARTSSGAGRRNRLQAGKEVRHG